MKAIIVVDMLNGFCVSGDLASPRLARVVPGIRAYLERELAAGARAIFLADSHAPDDLEFAMFPPHCVAGTQEAQIVPSSARSRRVRTWCPRRAIRGSTAQISTSAWRPWPPTWSRWWACAPTSV